MQLIQRSKNFIQKLNRPIGVSLIILLFIWDAGLMSIANSINFFLTGEIRLIHRLGPSIYPLFDSHFVVAMFAIIVIVSGAYAWFGNSRARYTLLVVITFYFAKISFSLILHFIVTLIRNSDDISNVINLEWWAITWALRPIFLITFSWWVFHTKKAKQFFQPIRLAE